MWVSIWVVTRVSGVVRQSPSRTAVTWAMPVRSPVRTAPALVPVTSKVPATVAVPSVVGTRRTNSPWPLRWVQFAVSGVVTAKVPGPVTEGPSMVPGVVTQSPTMRPALRCREVAGQDGAHADDRSRHCCGPVEGRDLQDELAVSGGQGAVGGVGRVEGEDVGVGDRRAVDRAGAVGGAGEPVGGQGNVAQVRRDAGIDVHGEGDGAVEAGSRNRRVGLGRSGGGGNPHGGRRRGPEQDMPGKPAG